jgi:hypothetical protein
MSQADKDYQKRTKASRIEQLYRKGVDDIKRQKESNNERSYTDKECLFYPDTSKSILNIGRQSESKLIKTIAMDLLSLSI